MSARRIDRPKDGATNSAHDQIHALLVALGAGALGLAVTLLMVVGLERPQRSPVRPGRSGRDGQLTSREQAMQHLWRKRQALATCSELRDQLDTIILGTSDGSLGVCAWKRGQEVVSSCGAAREPAPASCTTCRSTSWPTTWSPASDRSRRAATPVAG